MSIAACVLMLAAILGAFGSHSLKALLPEKSLQTYEIGIRYQFYHGLAMLLTGILLWVLPHKFFVRAGYLFLLGVLLFSGSLYLLSIRSLTDIPLTWAGPLTPIGGVCFIVAWIFILIGLRQHRTHE